MRWWQALFAIALATVSFVFGVVWASWGDGEPTPAVSQTSTAGDGAPTVTPSQTPLATAMPTAEPIITASQAPSRPGGPYTYTFDGGPSGPESSYHMAGFDVQVHERGMYASAGSVVFMDAQHGSGCEAPPATHLVTTAEMLVFRCKDHLMTAIAGGYGVVYLTPDRMLDWSDGEAVLSIDVSTLRMSGRDWWDLWLTEFGAQLALPLSDREVPGAVGTDLQGPPRGDFIHVSMAFQENRFAAETDEGLVNTSASTYSASSATQRDTFELRIKGSTFSFCKPDEDLCWVKDQPHGLSVTQAVVQVGHHAYDPTKAVGANANGTWHWDNLTMSDSIPYTLIRANERYQMGSGTLTFPAGAPEESYLRFSAIGKVRLDGKLVSPQVPTYSPEHYNSYLVPVAAGTTNVNYEAEQDSWFGCSQGLQCAIKDVSIVSPSGDSEPRLRN